MKKLKIYMEICGKSHLVGYILVYKDRGAEFIYDDGYLEWPECRPISISLPLEEKSFNSDRTKKFFEGLLPEGFTRRCVANWLHKDETDYISILSNLGRECLGAIKVVSEEDENVESSYRKLSAEEVKRLAQEGATESAELVTKAHLSLTGASGKVGLYYDNEKDEWYLPYGDAPSTHIVKQSHVRLKNIVANEQLCLLTAKKLGIEVPESFIVKTTGIDSEDVLFATKRYDRKISVNNKKINGLTIPYRLHQEDFAQALGIASSDKYETNNEEYLVKMFLILRNYSASPIEDQLKLWDICVFNYLIGNTDNHVKNLSLLYSKDLKLIRLAPAYDIVSTIVYETSTEKMALRVGDVYKLSDIRKGDFEKEAKKVGLGKNIAMKRFDSMSGKFLKAINEANEQLMDKGFRTEQLKEKILSKGGIAYITK